MQMWSGAVSGVSHLGNDITLGNNIADLGNQFAAMPVVRYKAIAMVYLNQIAIPAVIVLGVDNPACVGGLDIRADSGGNINPVVVPAPAGAKP